MLLLLMSLSLPADAQQRGADAEGPTLEERQEAFTEVDALLVEGKKKPVADALVAMTSDEALADFHAEAYARLAGLF
jgi:phage repressor protein C with HTH and peptisase S24 domain